jgi:hypothetical protein
MSFIDKFAEHGRPRLAPDSELTIKAEPSSRSLRELSKFDKESRFIRSEIKNGKLRLDLQHVIGDQIIINRENAIQFAEWIMKGLKNDRRLKKDKMDRTSRKDSSLSQRKTQG